MTNKASIATSGHNIANANTEGYTRQRVVCSARKPNYKENRFALGRGVDIARVDRIKDDYLEKQLRHAYREGEGLKEQKLFLRQLEDVFNELHGEGVHRSLARFFNAFRELANEPESEAIREAVRESGKNLVKEFHRLGHEVRSLQKHIDSRLSGYVQELNGVLKHLFELNQKIRTIEHTGGSPNDLLDARDQALKKIASFLETSTRYDEQGNAIVDIPGIGPLVSAGRYETFEVGRTGRGSEKGENDYDLFTTASVQSKVTEQIHQGKVGALLEVRDQVLARVQDQLDELAWTLAHSVNELHQKGYDRKGRAAGEFFSIPKQKQGAAQHLQLDASILEDPGRIGTALKAHAPGDNRLALALAALQEKPLLRNGDATFEDWYNGIVSEIGVAVSKVQEDASQQKNIFVQLSNLRDQISGVSLDEEMTKILQFQQAYGASAKVIQAADQMLKTVLDLKPM